VSDCLHEETAIALVQGSLASQEAATAHRHVDGCEACRKLLGALVRMPTVRRGVPAAADAPDEPARIADRYELGPVLGVGAMGIVYRARDLKLSRTVALKRVKCVRAADDAHDRLVREALAMAQLSHPAVLAVFDAGVADGAAYVAMEFVDGETLREWLVRTRPSRRAICEQFVQAAHGLATAHAAGIVHGDFKPDNVLVDHSGRGRVADFGLARTVADEPAHGIVGTPAYMAPELLAGAPASAASDQYAWAISLYEALAGERPYAATSLTELRAQQQHGPPRRRGALARIVERGLATDPAARFPSMAAAAAAIAALPRRRNRRAIAIAIGGAALASAAIAWTARGEPPLPPCSDGADQVARVWSAERKTGLGVAVVATLDDYATRWRTMRKAACEGTRAGEQSAELLDRQNACLDERLESLRQVVGVVAGLHGDEATKAMSVVGGLPALDACRDRGALLALSALPTKPELRAQLLALEAAIDRGDAEGNAGRFDAARTIYDGVVASAVRLAWPPLEARAWVEIGHLELTRGRIDDGNTALANAIDAASRARDDRLVADTLLKMLVAVMASTVQTSETDRLIKLADAAITRAGDDPEQRATYEQTVGMMEYLRFHRAEGAQHLDRALAILEHLPGDHREQLARLRTTRAANALDDKDLPRAVAELAKARSAMGDPVERSPNAANYLSTACMAHLFLVQFDQAVAECTKARDLFAQRLGSEHPDTAAAEGNLGNVLVRQGHGPEALAALEHSFAVNAAAYGADHPQSMSARKNLADALEQLGQHERARDHYNALLDAQERLLGTTHPQVLETMALLAGTEINAGDPKAGLARLEKALPLLEAKLGSTHQMTVTALNSLATAYENTGRRTDAIATFERAKSRLIESAGPDDRNVGVITFNQAELVREGGKPADALRMYDDVARIWSKSLPQGSPMFGLLATARGEALIALRRGRDAVTALETALPIMLAAGDEAATAQTELALAEALLLAGTDRARAKTLVDSATQRLDRVGAAGAQWHARAVRLRAATR
jgi:tetratricopeptide (TPR) repeat protein